MNVQRHYLDFVEIRIGKFQWVLNSASIWWRHSQAPFELTEQKTESMAADMRLPTIRKQVSLSSSLSALDGKDLVVPGDVITSDTGFMRYVCLVWTSRGQVNNPSTCCSHFITFWVWAFFFVLLFTVNQY